MPLPEGLVTLPDDAVKRTVAAQLGGSLLTYTAVLAAPSVAHSALDTASRGGAIASVLWRCACSPMQCMAGGLTPIHHSAHDSPLSAASVVLSAIVVAPWIEEVFFRAYLLPSLCGWAGLPGALLFQSLLFALLHVPDSEAAFAQYAVQGAVYGAVATASQGKLAIPVTVHSAYNALALTSIALLGSGVTS